MLEYYLTQEPHIHSYHHILRPNWVRDTELLDSSIVVATPVGDSVEVTHGVKGCSLTIDGQTYNADLVVLSIMGFDVILGKDWLAAHHAVLDCREKTVTLKVPEQSAQVF